MRRARREGDRIVDDRRAARREAIAERHPLGALEQDVGELPHRHVALAAHHLFMQERRIGDVLLGLGVEPRQPGEAAAVEPDSVSDFASTIEKIVRMTPEAIGSRISTRPAKRGCRRSSQSRGASASETSFSLKTSTGSVRKVPK